MPKLLWVATPLLLAAAALALAWWRGRLPPRPVLNALLSLLLLAYLAGTAALGLFWVAAQQLPVFDWHYLFGYATVLLVAVHLAFNLRAAWRALRRRPAAGAAAVLRAGRRRPVLAAVAGAVAAGGLGFWFGRRQGQGDVAWDAAGGAPLSAPAGPGAADAGLALVERYHAMSSHARGRLWQQAPPVAWGPSPPPYKPWPAGAARMPLPVSDRAAAAPGLAALGTLLWHGAGITARRAGLALRASPSSGALFSTELYVIARRVPGLAPGAWHYRPEAHALLRVADAQVPAGLDGEAEAWLVATAVFRRTGHKYRDRCYRYVLADLGHALENLRVAAAALRWPAALLARFDEARVAAALRIGDESEEGVLAVLRLGGVDAMPPLAPWPRSSSPSRSEAAGAGASASTGAAAPASGWRSPPPGSQDAAAMADAARAPRGAGAWEWRGLSAASHPPALGATAAVHRASSLRLVPVPALAGSAPPVQAPGGALPLPRVSPAMAEPLSVIARRRSVRRFGSTPLPRPALAAVLQALALDRPGLLSPAVRTDVVVHAVDGLAPGAYRYRPHDHALLPRRPGTGLRAAARAAALDQDVIGDAAAVLVLSIDRAAFAADASGAARGYRHAYLEAGLVGERVYLEAGARGLGACAVGAFYDDEAAALVALDASREWVVHFAALGVPG